MNAEAAADRQSVDGAILAAAATLGVLGGSAQGAQRVLALLCDATVSAAQIAAVLAREPGLALRVLRVANSAYYGASRSIGNIERALVLLGLDAVRGIAAAACLDRTIRRSGDVASLDLDAIVHHGFAAAVAAESLARLHHGALAADAFVAGLLHDLGVVVQQRMDPSGVRQLATALQAGPDQAPEALEPRHVVVGHAHCAAVLFEAWQLPAGLVQAARCHHHPLAAPPPQRALAALVHLGDLAALACGAVHAQEPAALRCDPQVLELLGLAESDLDQVARALPARVKQLREAFAAAA
jgi:HD-like signal output (HDOD) protein